MKAGETVAEMESGVRRDTNKYQKDEVFMGSFEARVSELIWKCSVNYTAAVLTSCHISL